MRIKRVLAGVAAIWLGATAATGQSNPRAPSPPDFPIRPLSAVRADKTEADRLIAGSGHAALFVNVSNNRGPAVHHRASGLICRFQAGSSFNNIRVYDHKAGAEDVSCHTSVEGISFSHYASQHTPTPTVESEVHAAIAAMRQRWPDLRAYEGETAEAAESDAGLPMRHVARASVKVDGDDHLTKVIVAQVGVWTIKQRMTVKMDRALAGDLWSETLMVRTLVEVLRAARSGSAVPASVSQRS